ncbi:coiled-coil-helix-coiled-coil-helix domain-containing protein 5-like [Amphiura filiformis]|uniref:coiled-coil-helix-coiled-coil-helix domain-containing protein 5-like n=1 Tax=Amphiura filiformis TaxID=82378 RepID=UPI003B21B507
MEAVISVVMQFCGEEMDAYGQCVGQNPKDWLTKCAELKQKAADCSSNHPAVKKINKECSKEYMTYDDCLKRNPENVTICVEALHAFMNCASKSASRIQSAYKTQDYEPNQSKPLS